MSYPQQQLTPLVYPGQPQQQQGVGSAILNALFGTSQTSPAFTRLGRNRQLTGATLQNAAVLQALRGQMINTEEQQGRLYGAKADFAEQSIPDRLDEQYYKADEQMRKSDLVGYKARIEQLKYGNTPTQLDLQNQLGQGKIDTQGALRQYYDAGTNQRNVRTGLMPAESSALINQRNASAGASSASAASSYARADRTRNAMGLDNATGGKTGKQLETSITAQQARIKNIQQQMANAGFSNASGVPYAGQEGSEGFFGIGAQAPNPQFIQMQAQLQQERQALDNLLRVQQAVNGGLPPSGTVTPPGGRRFGKEDFLKYARGQ